MSSHSDEGSSLLSESSYEILNESTLLHLTDDDEDEGSSVNSFDDDCSMDDITHIEDTDSLPGYTLETHEHAGIPTFGGLDEFRMDSSANTLREEPPPNQIAFEEPPHISGLVSVMHTLQEFGPEEAAKIFAPFRIEPVPDRVLCTVRQTMCQELLCLDEPFRFLYIGSPRAKDEIFNKLGAALALPIVECGSSTMSSDSKSSRFNVVPVTSFGMKNSAEVELIESFGVEMAVDVCTQATRIKVPDQPDTVSLHLNGTQWVRSVHAEGGFKLDAQGWKLPHLAVFFCSEDDRLEDRLTRIYTRFFMGRHHVPTLVISERPMCHKDAENLTPDLNSIHLCLESRSPKSEEIIHKRLPIDLATFTSLDVRQMNRNLACVTGLGKSAEETIGTEEDDFIAGLASPMCNVEKRPYSKKALASGLYWLRNTKPSEILMVAALSLLTIYGLGFLTTAYMKFTKPEAPRLPVVESNKAPMITTSIILSATTGLSSSPTGLCLSAPSPSLTRTKMPTSCVRSMNLASLLLEPTPLAANDSQEFKAHIIGENSIILRPPQHYITSRKPPPMVVEITRKGEHIKSELSKLFDGVYAVIIAREDAWGLLNVSVQTRSKPLLNETFEIDFGVPWFKVTGWKKLALHQKDELVKMASQASSRGKVAAGEVRQKTLQMKHQTQELLASKLKEVKEDFSGHISNLYQKSPSFDIKRILRAKDNAIDRAQRQAVNIWGRMRNMKGKSNGCGGVEDCGKENAR